MMPVSEDQLRGDGRRTPRLALDDLSAEIRQRYPVTHATFGADAIAEREGLLPKLAPHAGLKMNGWLCASIAKSSGERCTGYAVHGKLVCLLHGGRYPRGVAHKRYKHGGRSQYLPLRYHAQYAAAVEDQDLMSLRRDIATAEVRVQALLERLATGESATAWTRLQELLLPQLVHAVTQGLTQTVQATMHDIRDLATHAVRDGDAWKEVLQVQTLRAQLVMMEHKRLQEVSTTVSTDQLALLLGVLMERLRAIVFACTPENMARQILQAFGEECNASLRGEKSPRLLPKLQPPKDAGRRHGEGYYVDAAPEPAPPGAGT